MSAPSRLVDASGRGWSVLTALALVLAVTMALHIVLQAAGRSSGVLANAVAAEFLEVEQAFPVEVSGGPDNWRVVFQVAKGYYLYRDKLSVRRVAGDTGSEIRIEIPAGQRKFDENLGKTVETLRGEVTIPLQWQGDAPPAVEVHYQGCADAGLCYPPSVAVLRLSGSKAASGAGPFGATQVSPFGNTPGARSGDGASQSQQGATTATLDESGSLAARLQSGNYGLTLLMFFGFGVLLAFTPCVLPMVPILSAVIVGSQSGPGGAGGQPARAPVVAGASSTSSQVKRWRAAGLAATYVLGMSLVYTAVGVAAGLTGQGLVAALQTPAVLWTFAAFLMLFGVAMLGAWDLQLPLSLQNWVNEKSSRLQGGRLAPVFLMGGLSAVLVGPCVAPPLAGALLYLSTTGDWLLGGAALMALSWGLGAPLIVAAAAADQVLPKAGAWMESVKRFFGFLLIALGIYTAAPVVSTPVLMAAWCVFLLISAAWAGALQLLPATAGVMVRLRQGFAWVLLLLGVMQGVGAGLGAQDVFRPLQPLLSGASSVKQGAATFHGDLPFRRIPSGDVAQVIADLGKPAFLDFYADWCVSCKEMERFTFTDARVQKALDGVVWLQVDVTDNTADDKALMKRFRLFGPPGIVFFDAQGREIEGSRVVGFQDAERFANTVKAVYGSVGKQ